MDSQKSSGPRSKLDFGAIAGLFFGALVLFGAFYLAHKLVELKEEGQREVEYNRTHPCFPDRECLSWQEYKARNGIR